MTLTFWLLLIPVVLTFGLIAWATDRALCAGERAWRRYRVRREMRQMLTARLREREKAYTGPDPSTFYPMTRKQLDGLATSQDKHFRKGVH